MIRRFRRLAFENFLLKAASLILAIGLWFYIVNELGRGSEDERMALQKILPSYTMETKTLVIKPVMIGKPRRGYRVLAEKISTVPPYCIVVGPRNVLGSLKYIFTLPVDLAGADKTVTQAVPLKSVSPGIYMEETLVTVTIPIERI